MQKKEEMAQHLEICQRFIHTLAINTLLFQQYQMPFVYVGRNYKKIFTAVHINM